MIQLCSDLRECWPGSGLPLPATQHQLVPCKMYPALLHFCRQKYRKNSNDQLIWAQLTVHHLKALVAYTVDFALSSDWPMQGQIFPCRGDLHRYIFPREAHQMTTAMQFCATMAVTETCCTTSKSEVIFFFYWLKNKKSNKNLWLSAEITRFLPHHFLW